MKKIFLAFAAVIGIGVTSCSLDEYNPGALNTEALETFDGVFRLTNYCYEALYKELFTSTDYLYLAEMGTDIWGMKNQSPYAQQVTEYDGLTYDYNTTKKLMGQAYADIDKCNVVIANAEAAEGGTPEARLQMKGEAEFLRAFYYFILVEQYGEVTLFLDPETTVDLTPDSQQFRPQRNTIEEIYAQIITDLKNAREHLQVTPYDNNAGRASRKSAQGLLCRAYIQGDAYGLTENGESYAQRAKEEAEEFIEHMNEYGASLYDDFAEMWLMKNNRAANNKEALFVATGATPGSEASSYMGNSNSLYRYYLPSLNNYTDLGMTQNGYFYGRANSWVFVPSRYLLEVFPKEDKRFDLSFVSAFSSYNYEATGVYVPPTKVTEDLAEKYGIDEKWVGTYLGHQVTLLNSAWGYEDTGVYRYPYEFNLYSSDDEYKPDIEAFEKNGQAVYDVVKKGEGDVNLFTALNFEAGKSGKDADTRIHLYFSRFNMSLEEKAERPYAVINIDEAYNAEGTHKKEGENGALKQQINLTPYFCKYVWYDANIAATYQNRNGDVAVQRMAEIYLIAAEANQKLGDNDAAAKWINVLHERACDPEDFVEGKMKVTASEIDEDYILDEYARELCGEYQRWYVLKRHKAFESRLAKYNVRAAAHFDPAKHYLRPISETFLNSISNADEYGRNPGY